MVDEAVPEAVMVPFKVAVEVATDEADWTVRVGAVEEQARVVKVSVLPGT